MVTGKKELPAWKLFEQLVARIKSDANMEGLTVASPDRIRCEITSRKREVDASIRGGIGTADDNRGSKMVRRTSAAGRCGAGKAR
jgi:hypothetical protein